MSLFSLTVHASQGETAFDVSQLSCAISAELSRPGVKALEHQKEIIFERVELRTPIYERSKWGFDRMKISVDNPIVRLFMSRKDFFLHDAALDLSNVVHPEEENFYLVYDYLLKQDRIIAKREHRPVADLTLVTNVHDTIRNSMHLSSEAERNFYGSVSSEDLRKPFFDHFLRVAKKISPLAEWLTLRPKASVTPLELFSAALRIYGDPWNALGAIASLTSFELMQIPRSKMAVLASKLSPLFKNAPTDHAGSHQHFWGYLLRGVLKPIDIMRLEFVSVVYETAIQHDTEDRDVDVLALRTARMVNNQISAPNLCAVH